MSITNVLNNECVNTCMAKRRTQLNGEKRKHADVELKRNIVLFWLITTNTYNMKIIQFHNKSFLKSQ